jgi:hypothetical protein
MSVDGSRFPGGTYRISHSENADLCAAVGAVPDTTGKAHPIFYYIATQVGMGQSVSELLERCDFAIEDGPLMVSSRAEFERELEVERDYSVAGQIDSLVRKPSRAFGAIDMLSFTLTLSDEVGPVLSCTNQWVLPRRVEDAE